MSITSSQRQSIFSLIRAIERIPELEPFMTEDKGIVVSIGLSGTSGIHGNFPVNGISDPTKTNASKKPLTSAELIFLSNLLAMKIEKLVAYDEFVDDVPNCDVTLTIRAGDYEYRTELESPDDT